MIEQRGHPHIPDDMPPIVTEEDSMLKKTVTTLIMIGAFVGLAVLGWFALEESRAPKDLKDVPVIKAENTPYKVEPEDPGGMEVPHQNRKVFDMVASSEVTPDEPEKIIIRDDTVEPIDREALQQLMQEKAQEAEAKAAEEAETKRADDTAEQVSQTDAASDQTDDQAENTKDDKPETVDEAPVAEPAETEQKAAEKAEKPEASSAEEKLPVPASMSKPTYAAAVKNPSKEVNGLKVTTSKASVSGIADGAMVIKIGAYSSAERAEKGWQLMRKKHASQLSGLRYTVRRADLGERGVFYRLYTGPVSSTAEGKALCDKLGIKGCVVAKL